MLSALRHGVSQKEIAPFSFIFQGKTITCGGKGELSGWPVGFMDEQGVYVKALMNGKSYEEEQAAMGELKRKHAEKNKNPFYNDVKITKREYDFEALQAHVNAYLKENQIAGDDFKCDRIAMGNNDVMEVHLQRVGEDLYNDGVIDEDFEEDGNWKVFCNDMATKLGVSFFDVPCYYYPN